nr:YbfB/YjiJ family MFS transporter [uncultured Actinoplanes sp.]
MTTPAWRSLRLALGTASALGLGRFAYGLILPAMAERLSWDLARAGAMTTANGLGYLAGAATAAALSRRLGVVATFRLGMVLCASTLAATAASHNYPALLAERALTGFGGALVFIAGAVLAPTAVYFAGTGAGIVLSAAIIPALLDRHAERWPLAWVALASAAAVAAAVSWSAAGPVAARDGRPAAPVRRLRPVAVVYLLFAAGYIAYITFLSAYLAARHAPATRTTFVWVMLGLAVLAAPLLWERPIRRWPGGLVLGALLGGTAVAAALALLTSAVTVVIVSAVMYGLTFMAVPAAVTALVRATTTPERLTGALSAFTVIFAVGQMAGPWLAGALADRTTAAAVLGWTATLCAAGAVLAVVAIRARPRVVSASGTPAPRAPGG